MFTLKAVPFNCLSTSFISSIETDETVFVGVRKGDYNTSFHARKHYGSFPQTYYEKAISIIKRTVRNPVFYIFSNDIDWCKQNLRFDESVVFYRNNEDQTDDFEELIIMSKFKHAIICNSTFQWWGAFLINNPGKVIVSPADWFADKKTIEIVPPTWVKITREGEVVE